MTVQEKRVVNLLWYSTCKNHPIYSLVPTVAKTWYCPVQYASSLLDKNVSCVQWRKKASGGLWDELGTVLYRFIATHDSCHGCHSLAGVERETGKRHLPTVCQILTIKMVTTNTKNMALQCSLQRKYGPYPIPNLFNHKLLWVLSCSQ